MKWQVGLYVAAVLIPLAAFAIEVIFIRQLKRLCAYLATGAIGLSFLLSLVGFVDYYGFEAEGVWAEHHAERPSPTCSGNTRSRLCEHHEAHGPLVWQASFDWVLLGGRPLAGLTNDPLAGKTLSFPLGVYIDNLSVLMFLMVTLVATLIHIYSMGYMHDDSRYPRFFAYLSLFCFSMLGLVASSNVFMIFIFWELVGICSYLLIGFWYEEKTNCDAANKAFIVNRIGDVGMLVGLGILWTSLGTFNFQEISEGLHGPTGEFNGLPDASGQEVVEFHPARRQPAEHATARADAVLAADRRRPGGLRRLRGQERPVSAARLAARRDGRADAGLGPDPCGDHGGRRRLSRGAVLSRCSRPPSCFTSPIPGESPC